MRRRRSKAQIRAAARRRAPKHPAAPEAQIRNAIASFFRRYHALVREAVLAHARAHRRRAVTHSDSALSSVLGYAKQRGAGDLDRPSFADRIKKAAKRTAESAKTQTAAALGLGRKFSPDLDEETDDFDSSIADMMGDMVEKSADRAASIYAEWDGLDPEYSDRADNLDALGAMVDDGLSGIEGTALLLASMAFGAAFGDMIKASQEDAGVSEYVWLSQRDSHVREAHLALDGEIASWDDPPLKAEDSDSGEDCHPGEDYNCRCVASPVDPDEGLTDDQQERVRN